MTESEILRRIDHTLLKAVATWEDIEKLCEEAITYKTASVCVPPSYVKEFIIDMGIKLIFVRLLDSHLAIALLRLS